MTTLSSKGTVKYFVIMSIFVHLFASINYEHIITAYIQNETMGSIIKYLIKHSLYVIPIPGDNRDSRYTHLVNPPSSPVSTNIAKKLQQNLLFLHDIVVPKLCSSCPDMNPIYNNDLPSSTTVSGEHKLIRACILCLLHKTLYNRITVIRGETIVSFYLFVTAK